MMSQRGLTLIEILVAVMILVVGVLGAAAMQANGLRATRTAQIIQNLDADARSATQLLRQRFAFETAGSTEPSSCGAGLENCTVVVRPCSLNSGQLNCTSSGVSDPVAQAIEVTVTSGEHEVTLNSIVLRQEP